MAKSSTELFNEDEMKVITELQKDSSENISTIAKHCGFSQQKTARIIKRLEQNHGIWGYTAIVNTEKQGLQKFMLCLKKSNRSFEKKDIEDIMKGRIGTLLAELGINNTLHTYYLQGEYDWVVIFTAEDLRQARKVQQLLAAKLSYALVKIHLNQILVSVREHTVLNPDQRSMKGIL